VQVCHTCGGLEPVSQYHSSQWGSLNGVCVRCETRVRQIGGDRCLLCAQVLLRDMFSYNQWSKKGDGLRKCADCVRRFHPQGPREYI
jgi:hypothetical protein